MEKLILFFEDLGPVWGSLVASLFTYFATALGAACIFLFRNMKRGFLDGTLGFTGGVMVAASFWSLLAPSIEMSKSIYPNMVWMPAAVGFLLGAMFLFGLDKIMPHLHLNFHEHEKEGTDTQLNKSMLMVLAITLHNIPEGLAVGVLFGAAALGIDGATTASAVALTIGMAIQNFPEGFAVSMPLSRVGFSKRKSFFYGQLSGIVEPIAAVIGALLVVTIQPLLPFALSFAAGAMIFVVVEEVIPETQRDKYTDVAVLGFIGGFLVMMILDTAFA